MLCYLCIINIVISQEPCEVFFKKMRFTVTIKVENRNARIFHESLPYAEVTRRGPTCVSDWQKLDRFFPDSLKPGFESVSCEIR